MQHWLMGWRFASALTVSVCLSITVACGGRTLDDDTTAGDASADVTKVPPKKDAAIDVAPPPYMPQGKKCEATDAGAPTAWAEPSGDAGAHPPVVQNTGGPVLAHPTIIPITFDGDPERDQMEDFIASVGCTSYWHAAAGDYGVGDAVSGTPIHLSDTPPATIDDSNIAIFLKNKILDKSLPPFVTNETLYVIFYPESTDITLQGEHSCQSFGGYHNNFQIGNANVPYAVVPECSTFDQLGGIDATTATTSHELLEAVTDPMPESDPAYQFPEPNGLAWALVAGGEVGDLCIFNEDAFYLPSDYPFTVQHIWTNHAAYSLLDPCQPATDTYFGAAPVLPDLVPFDFGTGTEYSAGLTLKVGDSKTIELDIIAGAPWTDVVTIDVKDGGYFFGDKPALNLSLDSSSGHVGDKVHLTVTRIGTNSQFGLEPFVIRATSLSTTRSWWALVGG